MKTYEANQREILEIYRRLYEKFTNTKDLQAYIKNEIKKLEAILANCDSSL